MTPEQIGALANLALDIATVAGVLAIAIHLWRGDRD